MLKMLNKKCIAKEWLSSAVFLSEENSFSYCIPSVDLHQGVTALKKAGLPSIATVTWGGAIYWQHKNKQVWGSTSWVSPHICVVFLVFFFSLLVLVVKLFPRCLCSRCSLCCCCCCCPFCYFGPYCLCYSCVHIVLVVSLVNFVYCFYHFAHAISAVLVLLGVCVFLPGVSWLLWNNFD